MEFHTFGVFNYAYNTDNEHLNNIKDYVLLACLLHDVGKSYNLCVKYDLDLSEKHNVNSAIYFKKILKRDMYNQYQLKMLDNVASVLHAHHTKGAFEVVKEKDKPYIEDIYIESRLILQELENADLQ